MSPPTISIWVQWPGSSSASWRSAAGLVLVTHDRHLLDRLTTRMLELDRGRAYVHEGGYGSYLEAKAEREDLAASGRIDRGATWPGGSWRGSAEEPRPGRASHRLGSTRRCG